MLGHRHRRWSSIKASLVQSYVFALLAVIDIGMLVPQYPASDRTSLWCDAGQTLNVNPYSAVIEFSRQNLTSVDVRFCRLKSIPAL